MTKNKLPASCSSTELEAILRIILTLKIFYDNGNIKIGDFNHEPVEGHSQVILKLFLETIYKSLRLGLGELLGMEDIFANHVCLNKIQ